MAKFECSGCGVFYEREREKCHYCGGEVEKIGQNRYDDWLKEDAKCLAGEEKSQEPHCTLQPSPAVR